MPLTLPYSASAEAPILNASFRVRLQNGYVYGRLSWRIRDFRHDASRSAR